MGNIMTTCVEITNFQDINKAGFEILKNIFQNDEMNMIMNPICLFLSFSCLAEALEEECYTELQNLFKFGQNDVVNFDKLQKLLHYLEIENSRSLNFFVFEKKLKIKSAFKKILKAKYEMNCEELDLEDDLKQDYRKLEGFTKAKGFNFKLKNQFRNFFILNYSRVKLRWKEGFNEHKNYKGKFICDPEYTTNCLFMKGGKNCGVVEDFNQMYISIPLSKEGQVFVISLSEDSKDLYPLLNLKLEKVFESTTKPLKKVKICMPKFNSFSTFRVKSAMENLGVKKIFQKNSSKETKFLTNDSIQLEELEQYAELIVDEEGDIGENIKENCKMKIMINRPFAFFIVDYVNELILYSGVMRYPDDCRDEF